MFLKKKVLRRPILTPLHVKNVTLFFLKASLTKLVAPLIFESEHPISEGGGRSQKKKMMGLETFLLR